MPTFSVPSINNRVPPDVGLAPSTAGGPSPPPAPWDPCPRTPPGLPRPGALQKEPRGVGGRGREGARREGLWLEGRVLQLQWGMGGTLQTPFGSRPTSGGSQNNGMNGGSSASYLARTPCIPLFCTLFNRGGPSSSLEAKAPLALESSLVVERKRCATW